MRSILIVSGIAAALLSGLFVVSAQEQPAGVEPPAQTYAPVDTGTTMTDAVQVRYWIDRTALFPGDRVSFHLQISCAAGVDVLPEDLDPGQIELTGLELVDSDQTVTEQDGRRMYHVRHTLTTYDLNTPVMQIGAQTIRYYEERASGQAASRSPSGEIMIPAISVSLSSTLATAPMQSRLRDSVSSEVMEGEMQWAGTAGLLLILLSGAPVGWWIFTLLRTRSGSLRQRELEQATVQAEQGVLEKLRSHVAGSEAERRQGYDQLDQVLRDVIRQVCGIPVDALTSAEMANQLASRNIAVPVDQLVAVAAECELARYGRPGQVPAADRFAAGVDLVRRLLTVH